MTITEVPVEARAAVRARRRKEIYELDYRRELRRLSERGYSQTQISRWLGISQPSVNSTLRTASKVAMPLPGFSGATPAEICQRYAAGFIDRAQLVDELTRFPHIAPSSQEPMIFECLARPARGLRLSQGDGRTDSG